MNASDRSAKTIRQRRSIVIRREDHIGDPIGLVFLDSPETEGDAVIERLGKYLGERLKVIKAEVSRDEITVEIEARGWKEEGARMAAAARDLHRKGGRRAALSMYRDALELDPMNADAHCGMGLAQAEQEKFGDALTTLKKAREFGDDTAEILLAMGKSAARLDRKASAIGYYEQVLKIEPRNFVARRALHALKRREESTPSPHSPATSSEDR
jgi:tetratricopeptide (TPR) repeat protein